MKEEITINIKQLQKSELSISLFIILQCIYNKDYDELEKILPCFKDKVSEYLNFLEKELYIKITGDELEDIIPRQATLDIFQTKDDATLKVWISSWCDMFPKGVKSGGYYVRSNEQDCLKKMTKFLKVRKYSKETIFKATKNYVDRKQRENYAYMMKAELFIEKDGVSTLATECENVNTKEESMVINKMI